MYNHNAINRLVAYIQKLNGIGDKEKLSSMVKNEFNLTQDRKVFYSPDFAIRFSKSKSKRMSNTVLSLSALQKYDNAPFIDNVNMRGRVIEYLITDDGSTLKDKIINALHSGSPLPTFKTDDKLGDYSKSYPSYITETDIKTKVLFLDSNPKAYNIDKLLEFLSTQKSVYMIYLLGIDENKNIVARLVSSFDDRLVGATNLQQHWVGRNSRGVVQFNGKALVSILEQGSESRINHTEAQAFLKQLIDR